MENKEKTLAIITWCDADDIVNYGQVLQGCAMAKTFSSMEFKKVIVISYRGRTRREIFNYFFLHFFTKKSYRKTRLFIKKVMSQSRVEFHQVFSDTEVEQLTKDADVLVCGSDQIWHPIVFDRIFFLDCGKKDAKRIAYAASQPMKKVYPEYIRIYQRMQMYLKQFDAISVREMGSIPLIEQLSQKTVTNVVDPTLLVTREEWSGLIEKINVPQRYILMYIPAQMNRMAKDVVQYLRRESGITDVLCLAPRSKIQIEGVKYLSDVGTGQFLYLVKNASLICTSSFHGVIFSMIFEKQFWCFKWRFWDRRSDLRLEQITKMAGVEERLIDSIKNIDIDKKIDYSECNKRIGEVIEQSYIFLHEALI